MIKELQVAIKNPCSENWNQMSPDTNGRFCTSCQKTVLDFTTMEDKEILQWFVSHQGSACGRFRPDQLNRPITIPPQKKSHWRYWHYLIAGLLFSSEVSAQTKPTSVPMSQHISPTPEIREINPGQMRTTNQIDMAPVSMLEGTFGGIVVFTPVKRKPIADTISIFKDTLAAIGLTKNPLTIYPNPVSKGNSVTVSARLDQTGTYTIQLFSIAGTLMQTTQVNGAPKTQAFSINIPANLTPGTYIVRLSHPALTKCYTQQIVVL
jgi:Secretion system C-terminal sorting domain